MSTSVLTFALRSRILSFPKNVRGVAIAVSLSPTVKKVLPAHSANFRAPSGIVSIGWCVSIGRPATSGTREGPAVSNGLGSVVWSASFFNPKPFEVPMSEIRLSHGDTAHPDSLPRCLCHSSQTEALEEARALAFFLQYAARLPQGEEAHSEAVKLGSDLCFDLLLDKIEIAMGVYRFPYSGAFDAPALCIREG